MIVKKFLTGPLEVNTYLIVDEKSKEAVIIDLGGDFEKVNAEIEKMGAKLSFILLTHGHFDHISGVAHAQNLSGVKVYMNSGDNMFAKGLKAQLLLYGMPAADAPVTDDIDENSELFIGEKKIEVIRTPGHTQGGSCFLIEDKPCDHLFAGDTLFNREVGRCDLPGGNFEQLIKNIKEKLLVLDKNTIVYCGHGPDTTIGEEEKFNPYLNS